MFSRFATRIASRSARRLFSKFRFGGRQGSGKSGRNFGSSSSAKQSGNASAAKGAAMAAVGAASFLGAVLAKEWAEAKAQANVTEVTTIKAAVPMDRPESVSAVFSTVEQIRKTNPGNRCAKYLDRGYADSLPENEKQRFFACVKTGIENPDSGLGCYAMTPSDYDTFGEFFDQVIEDYHNGNPWSRHTTDWDISKVGDNGILDIRKLGLDELSMRVRVGRNLASFNLPGAMDRKERIKFELTMLNAFDALKEKMGGNVYSLTPDFGTRAGRTVRNPNLISEEKYNELVKAHVMFKDMDADPYLKSAGISSDWPYGRGCWQSANKQCIIWFGEEDQLRIMAMKKGTRLDEVFTTLKTLLDTVESIDGVKFAKSRRYGYVTSCPSNLGTGMRASVHIKVPNLTSDGTDKKAKAICKPLGLSVRGVGGEHTPIGADGTIDVSPRARLFIKERDIVAKLYQGIADLMEAEKKAGRS